MKSLALVTTGAFTPSSLGLQPEGRTRSPCQGCELPSFPGQPGQGAVAACGTNCQAFYSKSELPYEIAGLSYKILHVHPAEGNRGVFKKFKCDEDASFPWQTIQKKLWFGVSQASAVFQYFNWVAWRFWKLCTVNTKCCCGERQERMYPEGNVAGRKGKLYTERSWSVI